MDPLLTKLTTSLIYDTMQRGVSLATDESVEDRVTRAAETVADDYSRFDRDHLLNALTADEMGEFVERFERGEPLRAEEITAVFREQAAAKHIDASRGDDVEDVVDAFLTEIQSELAEEPAVWRKMVLREIKGGNRDVERVASEVDAMHTETEDAYLADIDALHEAVRATEQQGFTWVTESDFREGRTDDDYCWRRAFTLAEVWEGYPLRRERPAETGRDDRQGLAEQLTDSLADGGGVILLGRPGSGKTTTTRTALARWHERTDGGTVLYRRQGTQNQLDHDTLVDAVETARADGPVLVAVEDAARPETTPLYRVIREFETDSDVSFLLNSRETEWHDFREGLDSLTGDRAQEAEDIVTAQVEYLETVDMPPVDTREVERYVANYEAVTGRSTTATNDPTTVREQIRAQHGVSPLLLLAHHVPVRSGDIDERHDTNESPLVDNVREVFRLVHRESESNRIEVADEREAELLRLVALGVNVLNAAGKDVSREYLLALASTEDELKTIDRVIRQLDGLLLFGRTDHYYRTHPSLWSRLYLSEHLQRASAPTTARRKFTQCVNGLFGLLDDPDTRARTRGWIGKSALLDTIAESPAPVADELVRSVFAIGHARPDVAPLFGTTKTSTIDIPDHCSPETVVWTSLSRAKMYARRGESVRQEAEIETAREEYRERDIDSERFAVEYHSHLGDDAMERGNIEAARSEYEQAHREAVKLDSQTREAATLVNLGTVARQLGAYGTARERYETSRTIVCEMVDGVEDGIQDRIENRLNEMASLAGLGNVAESAGNSEQARNYHRESVDRARELGDRTSEAICLTNLGIAVGALGDHERAREQHRKSREICRAVGDQSGEATALTNLGVATQQLGDHERARRHHRRSLDIARETGDPITEAVSLGNLGNLNREQGDARAAMEMYRTASELFGDSGAVGHALTAYANLSKTAVEAGDPQEAIAACEDALELIAESAVDDDDRACEFRVRAERLEDEAESSARGSATQRDEDDGTEPFLRRECPPVQCGTPVVVDR